MRWRSSGMCTKLFRRNFNKEIDEHACCVVEGEDVLTLRTEEQGAQKRVRGYVRNLERKMEAAVDGGGLDGVVSGAGISQSRKRVDRNGKGKISLQEEWRSR